MAANWFSLFVTSIYSYFILFQAINASEKPVPSHIWVLKYLHNNTTPTNPPMKAHGNVVETSRGLQFDGISGELGTDSLQDDCIVSPILCSNGLSIAVRASIKEMITQSKDSKTFIVDTGAIRGNGFTLFRHGTALHALVAADGKIWEVESNISIGPWHFILTTWSATEGLSLYIDGPKVASNNKSTTLAEPKSKSTSSLAIGCSLFDPKGYTAMVIDLIAVVNTFLPKGHLYLSFGYSGPAKKPVIIRKVKSRFINDGQCEAIVYPDRGTKKQTGYALPSKGSTLLEFVLKEGPLPEGMTFRLATRTECNNENLPRITSVTVLSSEDNQVITVIRMTSEGNFTIYTISNGVLPNYVPKTNTQNTQQQTNKQPSNGMSEIPFKTIKSTQKNPVINNQGSQKQAMPSIQSATILTPELPYEDQLLQVDQAELKKNTQTLSKADTKHVVPQKLQRLKTFTATETVSAVMVLDSRLLKPPETYSDQPATNNNTNQSTGSLENNHNNSTNGSAECTANLDEDSEISAKTSTGEPGLSTAFTSLDGSCIRSAPGLKIHGDIEQYEGGLLFDGESAWVDMGNVTGTELGNPEGDTDGFGVGMKIQLDDVIKSYNSPRYLLDSGGLSGQGISVFVEEGEIHACVAYNKKMWEVHAKVKTEHWLYVTFSWSSKNGLTLYLNGINIASANTSTMIIPQNNHTDNQRLIVGCSSSFIKQTRAAFVIVLLDLYSKEIPKNVMASFTEPQMTSVWLLTDTEYGYLTGDNTTTVTGNVTVRPGGLSFAGDHSYLARTSNESDRYINEPGISKLGVTMFAKIKIQSKGKSNDPIERFFFDSGGWMGNGFTLMMNRTAFTAIIGHKGKQWKVAIDSYAMSVWLFMIITWRFDLGLKVYINGILAGETSQPTASFPSPGIGKSIVIGGSVYENVGRTANFTASLISFTKTYLTTREIIAVSPPLSVKEGDDVVMIGQSYNGNTITPANWLLPVGSLKFQTTNSKALHFNETKSGLQSKEVKVPVPTNAEFVCEHSYKSISCQGNDTIHIVYSNYGRTSTVPCQVERRKYTMTNCQSTESQRKVRQLCEGKPKCQLEAYNEVFGNPCPTVLKYLEVHYQCVKPNQRGKQATKGHFIVDPNMATNGLTIGAIIKIASNPQINSTAHIIKTTDRVNNGIHMYANGKHLTMKLTKNNQTWSSEVSSHINQWLYVVFTYHVNDGLAVYVNGQLKSVSQETQPFKKLVVNDVSRGQVTIGNIMVIGDAPTRAFDLKILHAMKRRLFANEVYKLFADRWGEPITEAVATASLQQLLVRQTDKVIVCQSESTTISCQSDQQIDIIAANYGRTSRNTCPWGNNHVTNCTTARALTHIKKICNEKQSCEIEASDSIYGNPCGNVYKYVEVEYMCDSIQEIDDEDGKN